MQSITPCLWFDTQAEEVMASIGGPRFRFSEAISLVVNCETQADLDEVWERLATGGEIQQCGWLNPTPAANLSQRATRPCTTQRRRAWSAIDRPTAAGHQHAELTPSL